MPPYVPRKRSRSPAPQAESAPRKRRAAQKDKTTLFNAIDTPQTVKRSISDTKRFLDHVAGSDSDSDSDVDSDDFEDVQKPDEEDDEDDMEWEHALKPTETSTNGALDHDDDIQDVSISVKEDGTYIEPLVSASSKKKGPSKREKLVRSLTHTLHVQALMWHNTVRNSWLNDAQVQKTLVTALPPGINSEIKRWKRDMGMLSAAELKKEKELVAKRKTALKKQGKKLDFEGRDWAYKAELAEPGAVNMSQGDPLLRLLKCLTAYWKKRFVITAPGIRKQGYMPLRRLRDHLRLYGQDPDDEQCGERVRGLSHLRQLAKTCEGSRDLGAQLFVALLRGLGFHVRMVASLQPAGFGFSKAEDAPPPRPKASEVSKPTKPRKMPNPQLKEALTPKQGRKVVPDEKPARKSARGNKAQPISLDDSDSSLSDPPASDDEGSVISVSDASVMDVTPANRPNKKYDRDLAKPVYWAEVLSTLSNNWIPVDAVVMRTIANNEELLQSFEPKAGKTDGSKQVICYVIAHESDGTAKDVTVRYLRKHQLPGKTKGVRLPVEKVPIYNRKGKVRSYEEYDWFQEIMLRFAKLRKKRTKADEVEDSGILKPAEAVVKKKELEHESLAWFKASADYVLLEHLRREEALLPGSESIKTVIFGKGEKAKSHEVYKREDVVICKTVESWHKEGRGLLPGEQPLKYVPIRAVTLQRKREIEDAQRETGEKPQQGLYNIDQTDWIIPDPIVDGIIPTNAYGNIDVFAPTMVPEGAVHLPLKGTAKLCRRLDINHAEAVTGFEFGKQRAVPVISGVVVARENANRVKQAWKEEQAEIKRKEDVKRTAAALHWWRKMLLGMRVIDRMRADYQDASTQQDAYNPFVRKTAKASTAKATSNVNEHGGGFVVSDDEAEPIKPLPRGDSDLVHEETHDLGGGFLVDDDAGDVNASHPITPVSLSSLQEHAKPATNGVGKRHVASKLQQNGKKNTITRNLSTSSADSASQSSSASEEVSAKHPAKRSSRKKGLKATPTRSPYFSSQEAIIEGDDIEEHSPDSSAGEVVTVRRTTARTRSAT